MVLRASFATCWTSQPKIWFGLVVESGVFGCERGSESNKIEDGRLFGNAIHYNHQFDFGTPENCRVL